MPENTGRVILLTPVSAMIYLWLFRKVEHWGNKGEPIMGSPFCSVGRLHPAWSRKLFKDQFAHELRAHDVPNFRSIDISLHALLVVYPSSLPQHFVCFFFILLK